MKCVCILALCLLFSCGSLLSQTRPSTADPSFESAEKALMDGRIADAKRIINARIHEIEQLQPTSVELVPYLELLAGVYGSYGPEAHALYERILPIDATTFGPGDSRSLYDLIRVARTTDREHKDQEEQLLLKARDLALQNPKLEPAHAAEVVTELMVFYRDQQRLGDAVAVGEQDVHVCASEQKVSSSCANLRENLAGFYERVGKPTEASQLLQKNAGAQFSAPELDALDKAGEQYQQDGLYAEAEVAYRQAAAWIEAHPTWSNDWGTRRTTGDLGSEHANIASALEKQGLVSQAEDEYKLAIAGYKDESPAIILRSDGFLRLLNLYRKTGRLNDAEPIILDALEIQKKEYGESSNFVADSEITLAGLFTEEAKFAEAEQPYIRALSIYDTNFGRTNQKSLDALRSHVNLLCKMHEEAKAGEVQSEILTRVNAKVRTSNQSVCNPPTTFGPIRTF